MRTLKTAIDCGGYGTAIDVRWTKTQGVVKLWRSQDESRSENKNEMHLNVTTMSRPRASHCLSQQLEEVVLQCFERLRRSTLPSFPTAYQPVIELGGRSSCRGA
jgi:hypothetical protein